MTAYEILVRCRAAGLKLTATETGLHATGPEAAMDRFDRTLEKRAEDIRAILIEHSEAEPVRIAEAIIARNGARFKR